MLRLLRGSILLLNILLKLFPINDPLIILLDHLLHDSSSAVFRATVQHPIRVGDRHLIAAPPNQAQFTRDKPDEFRYGDLESQRHSEENLINSVQSILTILPPITIAMRFP